jgi:tetratricopeptide (TPR) repeat protein
MTRKSSHVVMVIGLSMGCCTAAIAQQVAPCGNPFRNAFGPYDYRTATPYQKTPVEGSHFTADIESLRKNGKPHYVANDINYTLRVFPNHPRALMALSKLSLILKTSRPPGTEWTVDCYFQRATQYQPDDSFVRLAYGIHLTRWGKPEAARQQLELAEQKPPEDGNFEYNLGLAFLDIGDTERALQHAKRAYALGYRLPGLQNRLEKLGKWRND